MSNLRIAVMSDTHSNAVAFEAVIQDLRKQSPDACLFLGDALMRGPQPAECIELLHSLNALAFVRGNYDHLFTRFPKRPDWQPEKFKDKLKLRDYEYHAARLTAEEQSWLGNLPTESVMTLDQIQVEMYHASPDALAKELYPWASNDELDQLHRHEESKLILYGHIHHAHTRQVNGRTIVNCGSVGIPFDGDNRASYAIIDLEGNHIAVQLRRIAYDTERVIRIAKERSMPDVDLFEYAVREAKYPYYEQIYDEMDRRKEGVGNG